jgi:two-component system response regulator NreC
MNLNQRIKVVIADDHLFFRTGFKQIIQSLYAKELEFVGEASNGQELIEVVECLQPAIVITDIQMARMNGIQACSTIKKRFPFINVIALSMFTDPATIQDMLWAGAHGYVAKAGEHEEVMEAIRTVNQNQPYYCSTIATKMYGVPVNSNEKRRQQKPISLGEQEKRVIHLLCQQLSTKEIAAAMRLAPKTIEHYREKIQEKTGARNAVGIALYAVVHELINPAFNLQGLSC